MRQRFILYRRRETYYAEDTATGQQESLRTKSKTEALSLLNAKNESFRQPSLNLHIARTYLAAVDPEIAKRAWRVPMEEIAKLKKGATNERYLQAMRDPAFDLIRDMPILETQATHFLQVLEKGTVSTNVFLRRIHNFAVDMNWLPWPLLPKKRWPKLNLQREAGHHLGRAPTDRGPGTQHGDAPLLSAALEPGRGPVRRRELARGRRRPGTNGHQLRSPEDRDRVAAPFLGVRRGDS